MHKIMVVDDEVVITLQLEERLMKMGYEVVGSASSGEEAVDLARRLRPDLILMDIVMPGKLDGIEATEIINAEMDISVIFLTAYANDKIVKRAKSVEPLGYIVKPFRETELQAMIEVALYKKEIERKLQASELRYRTLFENSPVGIGLATIEGRILEFNDVMLQMTGYSGAELMQVNLMDTYQNLEDHALLLKRLQTDGFVRDFEVQLKRKDGTLYYASQTITLLTLAGEDVILTMTRDITRQKSIDEVMHTQRDLGLALSAATGLEETLHLCLDTAIRVSRMDCGGVYQVDEASGNIDLVFHKDLSSDFINRTSHYDADSENARLIMAGKPIYTQYQKLGVVLDEIKQREGLRAIAIIPVRYEGRVIACLNIASHTLDDVSPFTRVTLETIAIQIGSAIARAKTEECYRRLVESCDDLIFSVDRAGVFRTAGGVRLQEFGLRPEEVVGRSLENLFGEAARYYQEKHMQVFESGKVLTYEHTYEFSGVNKTDMTTIYPIKNVRGEVEMVGVICRDITERKRANHERRSLLKALETKNDELERFTYTVSHDLRSPLVTIQGFVEMLQIDLEQNEKEKMVSDLQYIANSATKMDALLKETLQLSRIGRVTNPPEEVPFGEFAKEALEQTTEQIKSSGVEVSVAKDFPTVRVDRIRIVEVLVNLIVNSINYMGDQPQPKIDLGYRVEGESKETVFFVKDNGIGIDPSQHDKVFELFYKADSSSKGTGAGLAIVKRIIEVHNGRIWIESEKGKGCTICFTLPVGTDDKGERMSRESKRGSGIIT